MTDNEDHFTEFEPHTRLKHVVLEAYLQQWAMKLLQSHDGRCRRVWFLDGFAGAGADGVGNQGSPTIAARVAVQVREKLKAPPRVLAIFCIEKHAGYHGRLVQHLQKFVDQGLEITIRKGEYAEHCGEAIAMSAGEPMLAFLDPFGLRGLDAATYRPLLAASRSEIFMLVADVGSVRHGGVFNANDHRFDKVSSKIADEPSLFAEFDAADLAANEAQRAARAETLEHTRAGALRALTDAVGEAEAKELASWPTERLAAELVTRLKRVLHAAGATHIVPFRVRDVEGTEKHLLLHASTSAHGAIAMKDAVSQAIGDDSLPHHLRDRLREDLSVDVKILADGLAEIYARETVPIARDTPGSLQRDVLALSPLFPFQWKELKQELNDRGWLTKSATGKQVVVFPPLA